MVEMCSGLTLQNYKLGYNNLNFSKKANSGWQRFEFVSIINATLKLIFVLGSKTVQNKAVS